ncbi:MAG: CHASE domain-containing protein, partial [Opitutaceae bacterium]|nr:CHASE domain-containing protein [Verrucomicrobiales bacterium]
MFSLGKIIATAWTHLPPIWVGCVLGAGILLSLALSQTIRAWEQRELEEKAAHVAGEQTEKLQVSMLRSMEVLHSIASLHAGEGTIVRSQFRRFVAQALKRQPELRALSWNPLVPAARRSELEIAAAADGFPGFQFQEYDASGQLIPSADRAEYVPVYFIEPLDRNAAALGYDLGSDVRRRASLEKARDSGQPVATAPIHLAQDSGDRIGFLVLLPVYHGSRPAGFEGRQSHLAGFAVAVFSVSDLVGGAFSKLREAGIEARLFDESPNGELIYDGFAGVGRPHSSQLASGRDAVAWLEVAGRRWAMVFQPTPQFVTGQSRQQSILVLIGGLVLTLLGTAYLYGGWRRTREIAVANAALQEEVAVRQRAEAAAASANEAKSDFLASMSHEIRTPLNAILGYTQLMQRDARLAAEQRDAIGGISASGHHLLGLINEILDLSKIEAGRMELNPSDFDLASLARGLAATFQPLCAQKRIGFRLQLDLPAPCRVSGDEGKLRQVLINLLGNAVKFTQSGEVYFRVKPESDDRWLFEVIDTGLGIPSEEHSEIFKPFHQGSGAQRHGGTGLGLAIARRQVELLGGALELQSERGIGSRFHFSIALASAPSVAEEPIRVVARLAPGVSVRVLVVDDRKENLDVLAGLLSSIGCDVMRASGGQEAMELVRRERPSLVFLDLLMPDQGGSDIAR